MIWRGTAARLISLVRTTAVTRGVAGVGRHCSAAPMRPLPLVSPAAAAAGPPPSGEKSSKPRWSQARGGSAKRLEKLLDAPVSSILCNGSQLFTASFSRTGSAVSNTDAKARADATPARSGHTSTHAFPFLAGCRVGPATAEFASAASTRSPPTLSSMLPAALLFAWAKGPRKPAPFFCAGPCTASMAFMSEKSPLDKVAPSASGADPKPSSCAPRSFALGRSRSVACKQWPRRDSTTSAAT
mmetsp:Transcript_106928/g.302362  ORF Transcript_106928/g.302362 Transcript_106928/m.302362 type:complete len:242 (+) Transcript_106928:270-995(+)